MFGPPEILQSDNGGEFIAQIVNKTMELMHVKIIHGSTYAPNVPEQMRD